MEKFSSDFIRDLFRSICQLARENAAQKIALRLSEFTPEPKTRFEEAPLVFEEKISYSVRAYTTDEIIAGIFSDDPEVYRFINRFYFPEVRHYILANSGTHIQAQDIFAEGLAIMLEKKREGILHFTANPGTWLYGVCRNL